MRLAERLCGVLLLAAVLVLLAGSAPAPPGAVRAEPPRIERYVALGDSFAAGPGIAPQSGGACARSGNNYAALLAAELDARLRDVSCSGARIRDFAHAQNSDSPPQYDALDSDTTLVTLGTIGGNDVDLVALAGRCVLGTCGGAGDATPAAIEALRPALVEAIRQVRTRAPKADIVVVGYGTYLPAAGCAALSGVTPAEAAWIQEQIDHLSDVLAAAAAEAGVAFADMRTIPGIAEHTVCAAPEQQWLRGLVTYDDGAMHPSTAGMAAWAQRLEQVVQELRGEPVDPWVPVGTG